MATEVMFGPVLPSPFPLSPTISTSTRAQLSISSSSSSSLSASSSSGSPANTPTLNISLQFGSSELDASSLRNFRSPIDEEEAVLTKIEELDDEVILNDIGETVDEKTTLSDLLCPTSPISPTSATTLNATTGAVVEKRPRGRPRKHPLAPLTVIVKPSKGRSKTGCITCRRRKKKCDETKPHCIHCQKNNVHCEGYPPKEYWRSGKQRAAEGRRPSFDRPHELPILIQGVENDVDRHFLDHFNFNVSRVLSLFTDRQNPFKEILLPMAMRHRGLMHSLLCLSGSHLAYHDPNPSFQDRQDHHFHSAILNLRTDEKVAASIAGDPTALIDDPTVAQTIVLCLKSICAGEVNGEYRPHLDAAKHLIRTQKSPNEDFQNFLFEFFVYHDVSNSVTSLDRRSVLMMEDFKLPQFIIQPEAGALLGVVDGLFGFISKVRGLRDRIRQRRSEGLRPLVDYHILSDAQAIDTGLRTWVCAQPPDSPRYIASMLYRQCTWLYLHRTILPSEPNESLREAVDEGLKYLRQLPSDSSTQSILLMPTFLLGCSAFDAEQRPEIVKAFEGQQAYSHLGNIKYARTIVEKVWAMMDAGDSESWDWETIIQGMGWDFLVT